MSMSNAYPLPLIKDLLGAVAKDKIFTKLDLRGMYFRVHIKEGEEWENASNTPWGNLNIWSCLSGCRDPLVFL